MAMDMLKRSIELLTHSTVSTASNYFSNVSQIITDSKQIATGVKDAVKKPVDFVRGMINKSRGGGLYKLATDWFYQRSTEFDSFDLSDDDDDFDAGFGDETSDNEEDSTSLSLDTKSMKNIARGQVGAMYQIGQKQAEANLANTAEIVTSINSRSLEIVASINNMTKSVINIDKNLANLVKAYAGVTEKDQYEYEEGSNPFSGGQLTIGKVAESLKNAASENILISGAQILLGAMKDAGPSALTDLLIENIADKIKIGDKSLSEHADSINEAIGNFMHNQFSKLLDWEPFKDYIGDFGYLGKNISGPIKNDYNRKKATFDGMTRKTIVTIIPQYLSKITTALTGKIYSVDKKGKMTEKSADYVKDTMSTTVTSSAFSYDIINTAKRNGDIDYKNRKNFNDKLIDQMQQWLTTGYVAYCFENYGRILPYDKLKSDELREYAIQFAWESYERYYNGHQNEVSESDFRHVCGRLLYYQLATTEGQAAFEQGVQRVIDNIRNAGRKLGKEGFDPGQATRQNLMMWQDSHFRAHSVYNTLTAEKRQSIENDVDSGFRGTDEYKAWKNRNGLGRAQKQQYEQLEDVKRFKAMSDAEKQQLIDGVTITENGTSRAATLADLTGSDDKLSEFGLKRLMISRRISNEQTDEIPLANSEIRRTLYDNGYTGNIGSLVHDIYKHLVENVTKVEVVNFPGRQNNSVKQILGPDGSVISNVQSSGGQGGIPSKLNLNTRGCGPIALNDLAERMNRDGLYDPEKGTNVGDYISTASNMGMNLHPGKATQRALNGSSPNNPVTVLGSGYGFGTAPGQLHYMNIVGSDGNGNLFTSNPMYGNGKFPAGAIVNNSVLGLFGSGYSQEPLTEEEQKKVDEAKKKLSELSDSAKQKLAGMDQDSTLSKLLFVLGVRNDNIDRATESLQNGIQSIGNRAHSGRGLFGKAKDKVNEWVEKTKTNISDDVRNGLDTAIGNINRRADAIKEGLQYADTTKANISNDTTISDEDKQLADQALSLMQAALQDGDGTSDLNAIKKVINKIKNNDLRQDLMNNVTGLINRSRQKDEAKPKTKIGKFILFGIGLLKKFLSPVFKAVKLAWKAFTGSLKGIWNGIKKYGKRVAKFLISPYIRGAASISVGAKSIKEGLFGKKTKLADGTYQREAGLFGELKKGLVGYKETGADGKVVKHDGLAQKVGKDFLTMGKATATKILEKSFDFYYKHMYNGAHKISKLINKGAEKVAEGFEVFKEKVRRGKDLVVGFAQYAGKKLYDGFIAISAKIYNGVRDAVGGIKKFMAPIIKRLKPFTDFVKNVVVAAPMWIKEKLSNITSTIADWATKIKNSKAFQWVKEKGTNIIKSKAVQTLKGQAKAIAGGGLDFMKGFAGGWVGVKKEAYAKGTENINKIFGDKNGGSDAQKTATAIADSNKTNTENLIKSGTENTKLLIDSFKESTQSVIDYLKESKEEEKKKEETATIDNNKTVEDKDNDKIKDKEFDDAKFSDNKVKNDKFQDDKVQDDKSPRNSSDASNDKTTETDVKRDNKIDDTKTDTDKTNEPIDKDKPDETPKTEEPKADDKKPSSMMKIGGLIGKIASGVGSIFGGITKIVMTAAMQLSGFKTLVKLFKTVINTAIKPLNKLFKQIVKAIKPIIKTLTTTLTQLVDATVQIVSTLLETLTPFLEPLFNVVSDIFNAVGEDLIAAVGGIIKILNPVVEGLLKFLIPAIKTIHGVLESMLGGLLYIVGKMLYGIGNLIDAVSMFSTPSIAVKLMETGNSLAAAGSEKFFTGIARTIDAWAPVNKSTDNNTIETTSTETNITNNNDNSTTVTTNNDNSTTTTINEGAYEKYPEARGMSREDVIGTYGEDAAREIYGSGDSQASYGTFLNMKERGCGPVALADAINRRNMKSIYGSGDAIDSATLARSMYSAGTYDVSRGTSVRDYIMTGASLGYGMTAGGVNQRSLKQASPTNPITLVGSGTGFGTRQGNTHYINVVGSGNDGFSYVSNPLTGRVSRVATNDLVLNSKLGIYGSGDEDEKPAISDKQLEKIEDAIESSAKEKAEDNLSVTQKGIKGVLDSVWWLPSFLYEGFFIDDDTIDEAKTSTINELKNLKTLKGYDLKKLVPDEERAEIQNQIASEGRELTSEQLKQHEYEAYKKYLIEKAGIDPSLFEENGISNGKQQSSSSSSPMDYISDANNLDFSAEAIADRYSFSTTISSLIGGLKDLASNFLSIFNTDDLTTTEGQQKYLQRLKKEIGEEKFNKLRAYAFIKFAQEHPPTGFESLEADTAGGRVYGARFKLHEYEYITKYKDVVLKNENWKPTAAELQMAGLGSIDPDNAVSHIISLLGGLESDGTSTISSGSGYGSNSASMGYDAQGRITTSGTLLETKNAFKEGSKYAQNPNVGAFIDKAKNAGMTPAEIATIISTGIWEDGGEKIFGNKSITATTYDYNGQRAEGIMNWVGGSHATTVAGQLSEIHEKYFNPGSYTPYSTFRHNEFDSQDIEAYKSATGRSGFTLNWDDKYGNIINTDLIEGSAHFFRSALVPESIHNPTGVGNYVGTAVGAYNWMLDKGYFTPQITSGTTYNGAYTTSYKKRVTDNDYPEKGNIYYNTTGNGGKNFLQAGNPVASGTNILWNCSGYAVGRFHEMLNDPSFSHLRQPTRNGGQILKPEGSAYKEGLTIEKGYSANPQPGDIISWTQGNNGHVAIVEDVKDKDHITISHSGYRNPGKSSGGFFWHHDDLTRGSSSDPWHIWNGYHFYGFGHNKYLQEQGGYTQVASTNGNEYDTHDYWGTSTNNSGNGKDDLIKTTASIYEAYEKVMPKNFDDRYQTSLYSKPITLRNGKTRKLRPDCSGIVSAGIQEMGYRLKNAGESGLRSWDFAGPTSNTIILDQNGNPSRDWEVLKFSRDKLQPGDITAGYWKTHGHVSMPIAHLDKTMPQGLDGGGNTNITNSINVAKQLLAGKSYSSVDYGSRSSGHYAMGSSWDSKTGGGAQRIWRYVGGNKLQANGINYATDPRFTNTNTTGYYWNNDYAEDNGNGTKEKREATNFALTNSGGLKLLDQNGKQIALIYDKAGMPGAAVDDWDKKHRDAIRMSKKWQKTGHDYWMYDAVNNITGAGDTSSKSSVYIPPIDSNSFLSDALLNQDSAKSVNNYYVAKDSSDEKRQELNILLNHTFNVRSESMETILTEMLEELKKRGSARQPVAVPSPATTPSLFDNDGIPPQIDRLIT